MTADYKEHNKLLNAQLIKILEDDLILTNSIDMILDKIRENSQLAVDYRQKMINHKKTDDIREIVTNATLFGFYTASALSSMKQIELFHTDNQTKLIAFRDNFDIWLKNHADLLGLSPAFIENLKKSTGME
ncbi:MAG: hypothetical protein ACRDL7_00765 [Gaiellaceae bacterium]